MSSIKVCVIDGLGWESDILKFVVRNRHASVLLRNNAADANTSQFCHSLTDDDRKI